jgi:hypothetical protein
VELEVPKSTPQAFAMDAYLEVERGKNVKRGARCYQKSGPADSVGHLPARRRPAIVRGALPIYIMNTIPFR